MRRSTKINGRISKRNQPAEKSTSHPLLGKTRAPDYNARECSTANRKFFLGRPPKAKTVVLDFLVGHVVYAVASQAMPVIKASVRDLKTKNVVFFVPFSTFALKIASLVSDYVGETGFGRRRRPSIPKETRNAYLFSAKENFRSPSSIGPPRESSRLFNVGYSGAETLRKQFQDELTV